MANAYRMTKDGSLDRQFLRVCAVYRAIVRYKQGREWAVAKLAEVMPLRDAVAVYEVWPKAKSAPGCSEALGAG